MEQQLRLPAHVKPIQVAFIIKMDFFSISFITLEQQNDSENYNYLSPTLSEVSIDLDLKTFSISKLISKICRIGLSFMSAKLKQFIKPKDIIDNQTRKIQKI